MKKFLTSILIISLIIAASSCKTIMMKANRTTKPKMETEDKIIAYLKEKVIGFEDGLFICKDSLSFFEVLQMIRDLPSIDFFSPNGALLKYSSTGDCAGKAETFAQMLNPKEKYEIDSSFVIKDIVEKVKMISGKSILNDDSVDYIIFIYWAKYLGKLNDNVFDVVNALKENNRIRIRIYFINVDFQQEWGMKEVNNFQFR